MALSKIVPKSPSHASSVGYGDFGYILEIGGRIAVRIVAPFKELGEDVFGSRMASPFIELSDDLATCVVSLVDPANTKKKLMKCSMVQMLIELSEDSDGLWLPFLAVSLCPATTGVLMLAGVSPTLQATYFFCAGVSALGLYRFGAQTKTLRPNAHFICTRAMVVMVLSGSVHLCLAFGGLPALCAAVGVPAHGAVAVLMDHIVYPDVFLYSVGNVIMYPMILLNVGYLAGAGPSQMVPAITLNLFSSGCMIASSTDLHFMLPGSEPFIVAAILCFFASTFVMSSLSEGGAQIHNENKNRVSRTIDSTMLFWSIGPFVQAWVLLGYITPEAAHIMFAMIDIPSKLGTQHIMLKSRLAIESAAEHFGDP